MCKREVFGALRGVPERELRHWLQAPGSLSARLAARCERFEVRLLRQAKTRPWPHERDALALRDAALGREVLLCCDGEPVVLARSLVEARATRLAWRALKGLGTRPLADLLFGTRGAQRSALEFARFAPASREARWARQAWRQATGSEWAARSVWARRSVFTLRGVPLSVMECFAPTITRR
jgi:chorismate--pyruvate lyase